MLILFPASGRRLENAFEEESVKTPTNQSEESRKMDTAPPPPPPDDLPKEGTNPPPSERRKALFEPLEPAKGGARDRRTPAEVLLPPPDFDSASYPRGWLVGKRRKLVNVDVVESMRRIAIEEMNRKVRFPTSIPSSSG